MVLGQVTWKDVELVQHPTGHIQRHTCCDVIFLCTKVLKLKKIKVDILLFSKATSLKEVFHVTQLHPQNLENTEKTAVLLLSHTLTEIHSCAL